MTLFRSFADGEAFSDNERATSELYEYGCVVICGAAVDLTTNSALATTMRNEYHNAGEQLTRNRHGQIPLDYRLSCITGEALLNEVNDALACKIRD